MDLVLCGQLRDSGRMKEYDAIKCGGNIPLENCSFYQYKLKQSPNDKGLQSKMSDNKCADVLSGRFTQNIGAVYDTFSALDKKRIEEESKYQRNKKVFIGGMVLLTVLGLIIVKKS
jgi:hypothetical protein